MALSKEQILSIVDVPKPVEVAVPDWGGSVYLKRLTFAEALQFGAFSKTNPDASGLFLLSLALCDEHGAPLFGFDELSAMSATTKPIADLVAKAVELNNSTDDAAKNS